MTNPSESSLAEIEAQEEPPPRLDESAQLNTPCSQSPASPTQTEPKPVKPSTPPTASSRITPPPSISSNVSSPLSELGSTPEDPSDLHCFDNKHSRQSSPRHSQRTRTNPTRFTSSRIEHRAKPRAKRRKLSHQVTASPSNSPDCTVSNAEQSQKDQNELLDLTSALEENEEPPIESSLKPLKNRKVIQRPYLDFSLESYVRTKLEPSSHHSTESTGKETPKRNEKVQTDCRSQSPQADFENEVEADIMHAFYAKTRHQEYVRKKSEDQICSYFSEFDEYCGVLAHHHQPDIDRNLCPTFDDKNAAESVTKNLTRYKGPLGVRHGSQHDSEAPSPPSRRGRGGGRGRGGFGGWRGRGRGRGGGGAGSGRDRGDSPDPPQKANLGPDDKLTLSHIRTRQAELKKFFTLVGTQQAEMLNLMASRDLSKMVKKAKAHTKVSEFDDICDDIDDLQMDAHYLIRRRYDFQQQLEESTYQREVEIVNSNFRTRVEEAQQEHIKGAEGDLIIFKNAHNAANDDTRTEAGSDVDCYLPRYHECPEPDTLVRGYTSTRIIDEKSLKKHLATYDEQAQREVIDDDVFAPLAKSVADSDAERKRLENEDNTRTMTELVHVADARLKEAGGHLMPRSMPASENPQFALSRLADASAYMSRAQPEQSYTFMPVTSADTPQGVKGIVRDEPPPSQLPPPPPPPAARNILPPPPKKAPSKKQRLDSDPYKRPVRPVEQQNGVSTPTSNLLPAIAPAPMRLPPPPPSPIYPQPLPPPPSQHMPYSMPLPPPIAIPSPQNSRRSTSSFTFTPAQTPGHSYFAPSAPTRTYSNGPTSAGHNKMHNTFVNQTIESRLQADMARENAARTQGQGAGPKGGKRILLPKV